MNGSTTKRDIGVILAIVLVVVSLGMITLYNLNKRHNDRGMGSQMVAVALESAVLNFQMEYGRLPDVGGSVRTDGEAGIALLGILLGLENDSVKVQNHRKIKFLSIREGTNQRNGLIYAASGDSVVGLYDAWGNPYTVVIDVQNDNHLQFKFGSKTVKLRGRRVAVHSSGPDRKSGTSDDMTTW